MRVMGSLPALLYLPSINGCSPSANRKAFPPETEATVYAATGKDACFVTRRLIESLGGIESLIDKDDVVILKPNSQWWHQGMTNTDVMAEFIQMILEIPNFSGEIIIADNNQSIESDQRAWTTNERNGRFNYNELVEYFNSNGYKNVTKYRWHPAGPNPTPLQFAGSGNSIVKHPAEGDGYIWPKDLYFTCPYGNRTILAYPVFTSSFSGITVDLKDGVYKDGDYTDQPIKFINFSALNHHGRYAGATASVKNFMGVVDMSCGYPAPKPEDTFNTHHIGVSAVFRLMAKHRLALRKFPYFYDIYLHPSVFRFRYTGGVLGSFMKNVRRADLNIITAITVGWGSRIDTEMAYQANMVIASTDPIALDFWSCANVLLPAAKRSGADEYYIRLNNPGIEGGPLRLFLEECRREFGGTCNSNLINLVKT